MIPKGASLLKKLLVVLTIAFASTGVAFGQGLTVWTTFQDQSLDWLRDQSASFTAGFGVDVSIVRLDVNELKQQALLSAPQGEAGDIFVGVPHDQIGELAVGGILSDMTSYATTAYLEDLSNQARMAYTVNGRLYGLPMFVEGPALVVNNDLVSEVPDPYE